MMAPLADSGLNLTISLDSSTPLYEQIESQLRNLILAGILKAGTTLPSVRALAAETGCSVITTRRAYQDLEQQGLIRTLQGRGTMVADVPDSARKQQLQQPVLKALREARSLAKEAGIDDAALRQALDQVIAEGEGTS